ncbi:MAG: hypothetical protein WDL87_07840 [Candidatus Omnitrophota bacterium]|jgi:hypothetical protein
MLKNKLLLILFPCLLLSLCFNSVFAQQNNDTQEIQEVIERFLMAFANNDLEYLMQQFSPNYLGESENKPMDFEGLKSFYKDLMAKFFENNEGYTYSDVKISNLDIKDDKATLELESKHKILILGTAKAEVSVKHRKISLVKENGSWKIVNIVTLKISTPSS